MGNWTTVNIKGTIAPEHVQAVRKHFAKDFMDEGWGCLHGGGICGLPNLGTENINAAGNLGERDYGAEDVAKECNKVLAFAPSFDVVVHVGEDYESLEVAATVKKVDGKYQVVAPEVKTIEPISQEMMQANLFKQLRRL